MIVRVRPTATQRQAQHDRLFQYAVLLTIAALTLALLIALITG